MSGFSHPDMYIFSLYIEPQKSGSPPHSATSSSHEGESHPATILGGEKLM
jgi:hypothetical protein